MQPNNTRDIFTVFHVYSRKKKRGKNKGKREDGKKTKNEQKETMEKRWKIKERNRKQTCAQGDGRVPRKRLLFAGTLRSVLLYVQLMDKHEDITRTAYGRQNQNKQKTISPMSSWWIKDVTADAKRTETDGLRGAQNNVDEARK